MQIKTHQIQSFDGARLNVYEYGEETSMPIFLAPPTAFPHIVYKHLIYFLSKDYRIFSYDSRGFERDESYNLREFGNMEQGKDILAILKHFNLYETTLFGWSGGSAFILAAAYLDSERIKKLILSAPGISFNGMNESSSFKAMKALSEMIWNNEKESLSLLDVFFQVNSSQNNAPEQIFMSSLEEKLYTDDPDLLRRLMLLNFQLITDMKLIELLPRISVICDILHMESDDIVDFKNISIIAELIPMLKSIKVIKGSHSSVCVSTAVFHEIKKLMV